MHPLSVVLLSLGLLLFQGEAVILWQPDRPLTWDDFVKRTGPDQVYRAFTYSGIEFEVKGAVRDVKIIVKPYFDPQKSWVNPAYMNDTLLHHEQGHFDLTAIAANEMDQLMDPYRTTLAEFIEQETLERVQHIYDSIYDALSDLQLRYDAETRHGTDFTEQTKWDTYIREELLARELKH